MVKPFQADESKYIFTEGIDYSKTSKNSIWGDEDISTINILKKLVKPNSKWVNLASGDGRYNSLIAQIAKEVIDVDIDEGALHKLYENTPNDIKNKLVLKSFNIVKPFPLESDTYDGLFSSGTLYLFPEDVFINIAQEISRILKVGGYIALEWAINIKRVSPAGKPVVFGTEPLYDRDRAINVIHKAFPNYEIKFIDGEKIYSEESEANPPYKFYCDTLLIEGRKIQ
ncbi:MAG TPA: methyltransferase domain-containing protein [Candidatus Dojkabacteria bacterium]|nr:methyltransferase domain-containing protein [Candidatus Dojkabacteria bacterium]